MMELVLIVCLQAAPERCEERSIGLYPDMTAMACVMQGQPQIAAWIETHPGAPGSSAGPAADPANAGDEGLTALSGRARPRRCG